MEEENEPEFGALVSLREAADVLRTYRRAAS